MESKYHRMMLSIPKQLKKKLDKHLEEQSINTPITYFVVRAVAEKIQREQKEGKL